MPKSGEWHDRPYQEPAFLFPLLSSPEIGSTEVLLEDLPPPEGGVAGCWPPGHPG